MSTVKYFPDQQKFSLLQDFDEAGYLTYRIENGAWDIDHTVINPAYRGKGLARLLVEAAAAEAAEQNVALTASCDYAAAVLAKRQP
ncbi:GNAT family N-acetyltransferase [Neisseria dentiae]|uniref:GNAT family N-acetyltransferase n=1 Tax=Neisseria dentiae TaxID=194197 RepID=A0A1X3D3E4_9NEIS|nr:GNAT family N-acetyltransferase [Neisseria dentiae]OSI14224.1 GNAT family N-acetyltransferase [Neisseria dentiae]QMT44710.1 N-acetyltransferase [Neisseria dentiae]STZ50424.1 Acetyltransferase (GNAT) family [Neisseria dentiae]